MNLRSNPLVWLVALFATGCTAEIILDAVLS